MRGLEAAIATQSAVVAHSNEMLQLLERGRKGVEAMKGHGVAEETRRERASSVTTTE